MSTVAPPKPPLSVGTPKPRQIVQVGFLDVRCPTCAHLLCKATRPSVLCVVCPKCGNLNVIDVSGLPPQT